VVGRDRVCRFGIGVVIILLLLPPSLESLEPSARILVGGGSRSDEDNDRGRLSSLPFSLSFFSSLRDVAECRFFIPKDFIGVHREDDVVDVDGVDFGKVIKLLFSIFSTSSALAIATVGSVLDLLRFTWYFPVEEGVCILLSTSPR